jgi:hypothetical protein
VQSANFNLQWLNRSVCRAPVWRFRGLEFKPRSALLNSLPSSYILVPLTTPGHADESPTRGIFESRFNIFPSENSLRRDEWSGQTTQLLIIREGGLDWVRIPVCLLHFLPPWYNTCITNDRKAWVQYFYFYLDSWLNSTQVRFVYIMLQLIHKTWQIKSFTIANLQCKDRYDFFFFQCHGTACIKMNNLHQYQATMKTTGIYSFKSQSVITTFITSKTE